MANLEFTFEIDGQDVTVIADEAYKNQPEVLQAEALRLYQEQAALQPREDEGFLPTPSQFGESLVAAGEMMGTGVTGALAGLGSYPVGMYKTYTSGEESGEKARQEFREEYTYKPRTQYGKRLEKNIGEFMQPAVEYMTEKTQALGEATTEATGSPTAGYAAEHLPMFLLDALGTYGVTSALKSGTTRQVPLKNPDGSPTPLLRKALDKKGISYEALSEADRAAIPATVDKNMVTRRTGAPRIAEQALEQEVRGGATQSGTAGYQPGAKGGIEKDPLAQQAIKQNWDEGFISLVKQANDPTKAKMLEMINLRRNILTDRSALKPKIDPVTGKRSTQPTRPSDIAGDALLEKARYVEDQATSAASRLNDIANTRLANITMDTAPLQRQIIDQLRNMDIKILNLADDGFPQGKPVLDFRGSAISKNGAAKRTISDVLDLMDEMGRGQISALQFHKMKRMLDELIDYRKSGTNEGALTKQAKNFVKDIRKRLNNEVRRVDDEYASINDQLTATYDAFDTLREGVGKNLDLTSPAVGQQLRRLFSNTQARTKVENGIIDIDMLSKELGGQFPVDIWDLAQLSAEMDSLMKPVAQTSFAGEIGSQIAQKTMGKSSLQTGLDLGKSVYDRARGVTPQSQLNSLEELLRRMQQQSGRQEPTIGNLPAVRNNTDLMP